MDTNDSRAHPPTDRVDKHLNPLGLSSARRREL